jgi:hypothetical protein
MRSDDGHQTPGSSLPDQISHFLRLADALDMPVAERAGILGISEAEWPDWADTADADPRRSSFQRRLTYILPLMQRSLDNSTSAN